MNSGGRGWIDSCSALQLRGLDKVQPGLYSILVTRISLRGRAQGGSGKVCYRIFSSRRCEVIGVDGARVQFPSGWGLVRASNTQPVLVARLVARCESRSLVIERDCGNVAGTSGPRESGGFPVGFPGRGISWRQPRGWYFLRRFSCTTTHRRFAA
ncbi:hypothetical protein [Desulfofundulus australicus]|uniref:hypothetical protein n=1 Tax=Desulfofundulus australicus TaxID=1566 RepID=UPI001A964C06